MTGGHLTRALRGLATSAGITSLGTSTKAMDVPPMAQPFTPMLPPATLATLPFTPPLSLTSQLQHQLRLLALLLLLLLRRRRQVVELAVALAVEQVLTSQQACR